MLVPVETIRGTVRDESGESLIGASVLVQGTGTGTTSDLDGNFLIDVASLPVTLEISYTGFTSQTVVVDNAANNVDVVLVRGLSL